MEIWDLAVEDERKSKNAGRGAFAWMTRLWEGEGRKKGCSWPCDKVSARLSKLHEECDLLRDKIEKSM